MCMCVCVYIIYSPQIMQRLRWTKVINLNAYFFYYWNSPIACELGTTREVNSLQYTHCLILHSLVSDYSKFITQCLRGLTRLRIGSVCFGIRRRFFGRGGTTDGAVTWPRLSFEWLSSSSSISLSPSELMMSSDLLFPN